MPNPNVLYAICSSNNIYWLYYIVIAMTITCHILYPLLIYLTESKYYCNLLNIWYHMTPLEHSTSPYISNFSLTCLFSQGRRTEWKFSYFLHYKCFVLWNFKDLYTGGSITCASSHWNQMTYTKKVSDAHFVCASL